MILLSTPFGLPQDEVEIMGQTYRLRVEYWG
jgi:hypothetical protein